MDLSNLNELQRRALEAGQGAILILAGPGTGKTKTLTMRIAYLLRQRQTPAGDIVALTFTNKAAYEMRGRLQDILGPDAALPNITTFHALGHDILRRHGSDKPLISEHDRLEIIRGLDKPPAFKGRSLRELSLELSRIKTAVAAPRDEPARQLITAYEAVMANKGFHDFDDLLTKTYDILRDNPDLSPRYTFVHVDEFQDTSALQYYFQIAPPFGPIVRTPAVPAQRKR